MSVEGLDRLETEAARAALTRCCGSTRWVDAMLAARPFGTEEALFAAAERAWSGASREDVLEALSHHPRLGEDVAALRARFATTAGWSAGEQAGTRDASATTLEALRDANRAYEARFGWIFVVCATGLTADEMLARLEARMPNPPEQEWRIAATEQGRITAIRLRKWLTET